MIRFVRFPWFTLIVVSGMSVISFSKPFFFASKSRGLESFANGGFFFVFWSPSAAPFSFASASRFFFASSRFFFFASSALRRFAAELSFLKRSLVFFRNGTWL